MVAKKRAKPKSKAVVKWDEELAKYADAAVTQEANTGGGQFFSIKSGQLSWQDNPLPNNEMAVIVLDHIFENVLYEDDFDADNPSSPACFAFAHEEGDLKPHLITVEGGMAQSETCKDCEHFQWGSADKGRGKACSTTRRIAMISAGSLDDDHEFKGLEDQDYLEGAEIGYLKLPVTSVKAYASYVKQMANSLRRPPFAMVTRVRVIPDDKTILRVLFEPIEKLPDELMGSMIKRVEQAKKEIEFPYPAYEAAEEKPKKSVRTTAKKKAGGAGKKNLKRKY